MRIDASGQLSSAAVSVRGHRPPSQDKATPADPTDGWSGTVEQRVKSLRPPDEPRASMAASPAVQALQQEIGVEAARQAGVTVPPTDVKTLQAGLRSPEEAVRFVMKFNDELNLSPEVLAQRNTITVSSPARFLRVNPALFYVDLKGPYAEASQLLSRQAPMTTIAGDCHLGNLGTVRGSDGKTIWGINDFDMAGRGTPEWDLERMATSLVLMGREARLTDKDTHQLVKRMATAYMDEMAEMAKLKSSLPSGLSKHEAWGPVKGLIEEKAAVTQRELLEKFAVKDYRLERDDHHRQATAAEQALVHDFLSGYGGKTTGLAHPLQMLDLVCRDHGEGEKRYYALLKGRGEKPVLMEVNQEPRRPLAERIPDESQDELLDKFGKKQFCRLQRNKELSEATPEEHELVSGFLTQYDKTQGKTPDLARPIKVLDMARRLDSGGSTYGLHRFYVLLQGSDHEPVIMEIKQELPTAPEQSSGDLTQADAKRMFKSMQALGGTSNPLMTSATLEGSAYFIREREREKGAIDPATLDGTDEWKALAEQAGMAMARAHAHVSGVAASVTRWIGDDQDQLVEKLAAFAHTYAAQTCQDCQAYAEALESSAKSTAA